MNPTPREQDIRDIKQLKPNGWTEFEVRSMDYAGRTNSLARIRAHEGSAFLDISIEEYTGETRRAKYTSVRLESAAARKLYEALGRSLGATAGTEKN
jgi:hypothetical protein